MHKPKATAIGHHDRSGGAAIQPTLLPAVAVKAVTKVPPANMAVMRSASGVWAILRSITLFKAKLAPPNSAK